MTVSASAAHPSAPATRGRVARRQEFDLKQVNLPLWAHPEVVFWYDTWSLIRDAASGEARIKEQSTMYLPQLEGMEPDEYAAYLCRATYYNFTGRTNSALTGSIFRRKPVVDGLNARDITALKTISIDSNDLTTFASGSAEEVLGPGRVGVLVDLAPTVTTTPNPYLSHYIAENILDWDTFRNDEGRQQLRRVVLREANEGRDPTNKNRRFFAMYRELALEGGVYTQRVYKAADRDAMLEPADLVQTIIPTRRGTALDFIPFHIFGPFLSSASVEKPPMEDIARLNISHYKSYANLEHGRFFVGFPQYYVEQPQAGGGEESEFTLGAPRVWITPPGAKPGILEMNGQGLKFLVDALDQKEQQAASLGGRMMGVRSTAVSESDNQLKLSERNEQSILLKSARSLDRGFTQVLRWWAWWRGMSLEDTTKIEVTFNKDFLFDGVGAREFRAIHAMYKDGLIPIEIVYEYLRKASVIPDWMKLDEFKKLLEKMETSFPGDPDAIARAKGFPDAKTMIQSEEKELDREHEASLSEDEDERAAEEAEAGRKAAAKAAALAPKPVPGAPAPGAARPTPKAKGPAK